jgi:adenylylsulfate kinase
MNNKFWFRSIVTRDLRNQLNNHKSAVLWFTGLSGAGKSTLAHAVEKELYKKKYRTIVLDGDNLRHGLCGDLGFSANDRKENIRRIGEVSKLFFEAGVITLAAAISPFKDDRKTVRGLFSHGDFIEIFVDCPIEVCEERDPKGIYAKARKGVIKDFTGLRSPYEVPIKPELIVSTASQTIDKSVELVIAFLLQRGLVS